MKALLIPPAPQGCLYVSDLDGTLLDATGRLSPHSRSELVRLVEDGLTFTVASARSHCSISQIFGDFPFPIPIVEFNGAFITDYRTGQHLSTCSLPKALCYELFALVVDAGLHPFVSSYDGERDRLHYDRIANASMAWYEARRKASNDPRLNRSADLALTLEERVVCLTIMDDGPNELRRLNNRIQERFGNQVRTYFYENAYNRGNYWLSIFDAAASKHNAVRALRDAIDKTMPVVALGDHLNDVEMLRSADLAVAVENAEPEVLRVAHRVIGPHTEDSVVAFLQSHRALALQETSTESKMPSGNALRTQPSPVKDDPGEENWATEPRTR